MPALEEPPQRLFIGVPVSESARLAISRQVPASLPGRQSPLENWHFTLRFIGNADATQRAKLIEKLSAIDFGDSFDIEFEQFGAFPNPRRARVVWVGVGKGREEDLVAREKALKEANSRIADLEKNLADLKKLAELKSQGGAELQKQAQMQKTVPTPDQPSAAASAGQQL